MLQLKFLFSLNVNFFLMFSNLKNTGNDGGKSNVLSCFPLPHEYYSSVYQGRPTARPCFIGIVIFILRMWNVPYMCMLLCNEISCVVQAQTAPRLRWRTWALTHVPWGWSSRPLRTDWSCVSWSSRNSALERLWVTLPENEPSMLPSLLNSYTSWTVFFSFKHGAYI